MKHLIDSPERNEYRETWKAYLIYKTSDRSFYKSMDKKKTFFMNRYAQSTHHTNLDLFSFFCFYEQQKDFFKRSHADVKNFIQKYVDPS
jgi:hypothetical protein